MRVTEALSSTYYPKMGETQAQEEVLPKELEELHARMDENHNHMQEIFARPLSLANYRENMAAKQPVKSQNEHAPVNASPQELEELCACLDEGHKCIQEILARSKKSHARFLETMANIRNRPAKSQTELSTITLPNDSTIRRKWVFIGGVSGGIIAGTVAKILAVSSILNLVASILSGALIGILSVPCLSKIKQTIQSKYI